MSNDLYWNGAALQGTMDKRTLYPAYTFVMVTLCSIHILARGGAVW